MGMVDWPCGDRRRRRFHKSVRAFVVGIKVDEGDMQLEMYHGVDC